MSISSRLIETKVYQTGESTEERRRHQLRDDDGTPVLNIDTINTERYSSTWYADVSLDQFHEILEENYVQPLEVESKAIYRLSDVDLGEKFVSTYERILEHDRHPESCVYLEFRYGPHVLSWSEQEDEEENRLSLSVRDNDVEPLNRYFEATAHLPQEEIQEVLDRATEDILTDMR